MSNPAFVVRISGWEVLVVVVVEEVVVVSGSKPGPSFWREGGAVNMVPGKTIVGSVMSKRSRRMIKDGL